VREVAVKLWKVAVVVTLVAATVYLAPGAWRLKATYMKPLVNPATLTGVNLSPPTVTLVPSQTIQFAVVGKFSDGGQEPIAVTLAATGGTITSDGLFSAGTATGAFSVIATASGSSLADTSAVTITPLSTAPDMVKLSNQKPATAQAAVLIDGPVPGSCANDDVFLGSGTIAVGNLLAPSNSCPAEVATFSSGNAMMLDAPVNTWTDNGGDLRNEALTPPLRVPLVIWVAAPVPSGTNKPLDDLKDAAVLFSDNRAGIDFDTSSSAVRSATSMAAQQTIGYGCATATGLPGSAYYIEARLNVYYVDHIDPNLARGWTCVDRSEAGIIYVSMNDRVNTTLAHEIGHALGLQIPFDGHTDPINALDQSNLMWSLQDVVVRDKVTLGQAYRLNAERLSWLNGSAGLRPGQPTRDCGCNPFHADVCPVLPRDGAGAVVTSYDPSTALGVMICKMDICQASAPGNDCTGLTLLAPGTVIPLAIGGSTWLRSTARDTLNNKQSSSAYKAVWSSANPGVAAVSVDGNAFGINTGCAVLTGWIHGLRTTVKVRVNNSGAC
jgi:hypothetical protein